MAHRIGSSLFAATIALALLFSAPAQALYAVFISGNGDNLNNCATPAEACCSFQRAQIVADAGGVIHVLAGDYAPVIITKSLQIIADGGQASIAAGTASAGGVTAGIVVNAGPTDVVAIRGMIVDRYGFGGGGIGLVAGGALHVENCTLVNSINDFGIVFRPTASSELFVSNCTIANNGGGGTGGGIEVRPGAGASAKVNIKGTRVLNNRAGIEIFNRGKVTVRDSTIAGNGIGVRVQGVQAFARIGDSTISGNQVGLQVDGGGLMQSHRGNVLTDNVVDGAFNGLVNPL